MDGLLLCVLINLSKFTLGPETRVTRSFLVLAVFLIGLVSASAAHAAGWTPAGKDVAGTAASSQLTYSAGVVITCGKTEIVGKTRNPVSTQLDVSPVVPGKDCAVGGITATATCVGTITLDATTASSTSGTATLDSNFNCTFVATVFGANLCTITIGGTQAPTGGWVLNEGLDSLTVTLTTISAARGGSSLCGPATSTTASITASFTVTPTDLAVL
jgi:hypothetical protein